MSAEGVARVDRRAACPRRGRGRCGARRARPGGRAARGPGGSRAPSRRSRPRADRRRGARSRPTPRRATAAVSFGCTPAVVVTKPGWAAAISRPRRRDARSIVALTMWPIPAARARSRTSWRSAANSGMSRWACVSISTGSSRRSLDDPGEERTRRAQLRPGGSRSQPPGATAAGVPSRPRSRHIRAAVAGRKGQTSTAVARSASRQPRRQRPRRGPRPGPWRAPRASRRRCACSPARPGARSPRARRAARCARSRPPHRRRTRPRPPRQRAVARGRVGHSAGEVLAGHREHAGEEVAQVVGQVGVDRGRRAPAARSRRRGRRGPRASGSSATRRRRSGPPARPGRRRCRPTWTSCAPRSSTSRGRRSCAGRRCRRRGASSASRPRGWSGCPCRRGGAPRARSARSAGRAVP